MQDAQGDDGGFSDVSPRIIATNNGAPAWGDAGIVIPWAMYNMYGNKEILKEYYDAFVKWVEYVKANNPDLLWKNKRGGDYGDWLYTRDVTDKELLATAFFAHSADLLSKIADVLGKNDDATEV